MTSTDRARYIDGLRVLAQVLEDNPEVPLPYEGNATRMTFHFLGGPEEREAMAACARALPCAWQKNVREYDDEHGQVAYLDLQGALAGLKIELTAYRDTVCTRRVVGTEDREVEEVVRPAETRKVVKPVEVVEWDCGPLLRPAVNGSKAAAVTR